jgi:hypothetical protein
LNLRLNCHRSNKSHIVKNLVLIAAALVVREAACRTKYSAGFP